MICATRSSRIACCSGTAKVLNPRSPLPHLATYLGHKDIVSTLVYLNITPELLQQASERYRRHGAARCAPSEVRHEGGSTAYWLHAFFHEWLGQQRNCSSHTILSYRDTWRLYLRYVAARPTSP